MDAPALVPNLPELIRRNLSTLRFAYARGNLGEAARLIRMHNILVRTNRRTLEAR